MEKDSGRYCYEPYPAVAKGGPAATSKKESSKEETAATPTTCCKCFQKKSKSKAFLTGLATNLGICVLLFGYTLIGSVIFLAIEGGPSLHHHQHQILATTSLATNRKRPFNSTEFRARTDEFRAKTVENIWDITVSLNILYRDNWTRLAAQEITRFQDEILRSITEDGAQDYASSEERTAASGHDHFEWTFAKSFLYSLTVLTTIGKLYRSLQSYAITHIPDRGRGCCEGSTAFMQSYRTHRKKL
ncbi:PREDICTED: uncharacterized protein LOC108565342 [Nicrophorus vespilloides]|uniref:Uncharacterized protein LOC108565342 n=1 Tax=Nicrophorus vespilloides TaxID=110193 RepID=A0ABM1N0A3_NICVS|nr:PREDICTED: uncharacterized protein LOC108565342 [Nicrophorus vespilloides]